MISSTLKEPLQNYTCFILRRFGLFLIHLQSKNKTTLGNASNSKPKDSVTQKMSKAKPRPPTLSNSLKVKAGPTAMQKVLKQNLHKIVIYENKPRPAARDRSQSAASVGCKKLLQSARYVYVSTNSIERNMYQHKN